MNLFILIVNLLFTSLTAQSPGMAIPANSVTERPSSEMPTIGGTAAERYLAPEFNELAGLLGCAAGCKYKPLNPPQLAVCVAATHLGDKISQLAMCGVADTTEKCAVATDMKNGKKCEWVKHPASWTVPLATTHFCLPQIIADKKEDFLGGLSAFKPLFQPLRDLTTRSGTVGNKPVHYLMSCLEHKTAGKCRLQTYGCKLCPKILPDYYPTMGNGKITQLCLPTELANVACDLINKPLDTAMRPMCPLMDVKALIDKQCKMARCPDPLSLTCAAATV